MKTGFASTVHTDVSGTLQGESLTLFNEAVQVRMMRELFTRTRESSVLGLMPMLLLSWAHWGAQPILQLLLWAGCLGVTLLYRFCVAHTFLIQPQAQAARLRIWFRLECVGVVMLALVYVSSITLLGSGHVDALFHLRLALLVGMMAFLLSVLGMDIRLYASCMVVTVVGTLILLHGYYPGFLAELPMVQTGFMIYGFMLLVRSRGEHKRTKQWIGARLNQRLLMERLTKLRLKESEVNEVLRAKSVELEDKNRQLNQLAIHDGLTGAYRRGHIEGELQRLVRNVQRKPSQFSLMLMDIDWFKKVNDLHGHTVGDEVLRCISALVQKTLRGSDLFGRWGGEEFMVLMPETGIAEAVEAAERVREAVRTLEFSGEGVRFGVTISVGVAQLEPSEAADMLVQRVDKALYAAKHAGRDRVLAYAMGHNLFSPLRI